MSVRYNLKLLTYWLTVWPLACSLSHCVLSLIDTPHVTFKDICVNPTRHLDTAVWFLVGVTPWRPFCFNFYLTSMVLRTLSSFWHWFCFDSVGGSALTLSSAQPLTLLTTPFFRCVDPLHWIGWVASWIALVILSWMHKFYVVLNSSRSLWSLPFLGYPRVLSWVLCCIFSMWQMSAPCWYLRGFCANV